MNVHNAMEFFENQQTQVRLAQRELDEDTERLIKARAALDAEQTLLGERRKTENRSRTMLTKVVQDVNRANEDLGLVETLVDAVMRLEHTSTEKMQKLLASKGAENLEFNAAGYGESIAWKEISQDTEEILPRLMASRQRVLDGQEKYNVLLKGEKTARTKCEDMQTQFNEAQKVYQTERREEGRLIHEHQRLQEEIVQTEHKRLAAWENRLTVERKRIQDETLRIQVYEEARLLHEHEMKKAEATNEEKLYFLAMNGAKENCFKLEQVLQDAKTNLKNNQEKIARKIEEFQTAIQLDNLAVFKAQKEGKFLDESKLDDQKRMIEEEIHSKIKASKPDDIAASKQELDKTFRAIQFQHGDMERETAQAEAKLASFA